MPAKGASSRKEESLEEPVKPEVNPEEDRMAQLEKQMAQALEQNATITEALTKVLSELGKLKSANATETKKKGKHPVRPSPPAEFDGDRSKGRAFLNSCRLFLFLSEDVFNSDQERIYWALSFMKSGRASKWAQRLVRRERETNITSYRTWGDFEDAVEHEFCPRNETLAAGIKLESESYFQGKRSVVDYVEEFKELAEDSGLETSATATVLKFRRGLDPTIQDQIAMMGLQRPRDDRPEEWYKIAKMVDENREANAAFRSASRNRPWFPRQAEGKTPLPRTTFVIPGTKPPAPTPPPRTPQPRPEQTAADSDKRKVITGVCRRCRKPGHYAAQCNQPVDIRALSMEERTELLQQLLVMEDMAKVQQPAQEESEEEELEEDFQETDG